MDMELLSMIAGLAILDTLSPATMAVTIYLLVTNSERLTLRLLVYLSAVAGFYFLIGALLMLGLDALLGVIMDIFKSKLVSWTVFIIGMILFIASFYVPEKKNPEGDHPKPKSNSIFSMITLGFTTFLIEVATAFPYFTAIGLMATAELSLFEWPFILLGYNFVMIFPPLILFVVYFFFGKWLREPLDRFRVKISNKTGSAISWIMAIVGLILIVNSLDYL